MALVVCYTDLRKQAPAIIEVGGFATAMHIPLVITSMQNISLFIRLLKPSLFLVDLDSIEKRHTHLIKRYKHKLAVHDYFQVDQPYLKSFNKYDIDDIDEMVDLFFSVASQNLDKMDRSLLENNDRVYVTGSPMYDRLRNTQILSSPLQEHQRYYTFVQDHPRPNTISFGATDPKHSSALKMFRVANRNCSMELWSGRLSLHLVASIFILSAGLQIYRSIAKAFCSQQSESCRSKYPLSACLRQIDTLSLKYKVAANLTGVFMKI